MKFELTMKFELEAPDEAIEAEGGVEKFRENMVESLHGYYNDELSPFEKQFFRSGIITCNPIKEQSEH